MLFSELYSAYYSAVAAVLTAACDHRAGKEEIREIIRERAFSESLLSMEPALTKGEWQLLLPDGTTPLCAPPTMPLTTLQRRWLAAICQDPRIRLFTDELPSLGDTEPLFSQEDILLFDRYADGDPYGDEDYIRRFRLILRSIRERTPLSIDSIGRGGAVIHRTLMPERLEYSEKDDKFRLIGSGCRYGYVVNLARILRCYPSPVPPAFQSAEGTDASKCCVTLELWDERNALERVLMHFSHLEKQAEKLEEGHYRVTLTYDLSDETEMIIRLLSFGPMIRVTGPEDFVEKIRSRLILQKQCDPGQHA
ncbi:MAG: WYL domain-containing protein [Clostridia bacterium]|nr:WYL domain-containing protein [Clostridia bacterium]